jgi:hypothetical protein
MIKYFMSHFNIKQLELNSIVMMQKIKIIQFKIMKIIILYKNKIHL